MANVNKRGLRALLVEDVEDDALLVVDYLQHGGFDLEWQIVDTEPALIEALRKPWDIVLVDFSMPHLSGAKALNVVRRICFDIPLIFVSGTIGEDNAVEAMRAGAQDYVMKGSLKRLLPAIERELRESRERRERRQFEQTLRQLSLVVQQTADSVFITDPNGRIEYANPAFEKLTGYTASDVLGKTPAILRSSEQAEDVYPLMWSDLYDGRVFRGTLINQSKNGDIFHEEKVITPLKDEYGNVTHFVSTGRDITARVRADQERNRLAAILEATPDLVAILEPGGYMRYLNNAGRRLLGLRLEDDVSMYSVNDLFSEEVTRQFLANTDPEKIYQGVWSGEAILHRAAAAEVPVSLVVLEHTDAAGKVEYLSVIVRDISERKQFEAQLQYQATHDSLTRLPNRYLLADRCLAELERAQRHNGCVAVLFLDMDNFKRINDSLGHAAGDVLLQKVAQHLQGCLRPGDTVARHGGDEFTVLTGDLSTPVNVLAILRKIHRAFAQPIIIDSHEIYVAFSIGVAVYPQDGDSIESLLKNADTAMYQAKAIGPNQFRFYAAEMNAHSHEFLTLESELRHALEHGDFVLHYQPQIDLSTGRLVSVEALIRWQHPERGLIPPADFIPLLEGTGLIIPVGEWALRQACIDHREGRKRNFANMRVTVNVSAAQFIDVNLLDTIKRILKEESMPAEMLELEITENAIMRNTNITAEILQSLNKLGVRIAIDDFGTGYSSLAYLKRFPLDVLKVDQSFVRDMTIDAGDAVIVEASISLAQKLGLEVVAEGVETEEQLELLRAQHCDMAQGYLLSRPLISEKLFELLKSEKHW